VFWVCAIGAIYSYVIYPATLLLLPRRAQTSKVSVSVGLNPAITLVIACRNEVHRIRHKLDNALQLDYPSLEIIVASDASDDGSDDVVKSYAEHGVRLVRSSARMGKEYAQRLAVTASTGSIVVFSDAGTELLPSSIKQIASTLSDPSVGAVSSEDRFVSSDGRLVGEGAYIRYEMWLRRLEGSVNSLVGLSGSFFAVRRDVATLWDDSIPSDLACAINAYRRGLRAVSDPLVVGIYKDIRDPSREFDRKVRTALRGMAAIGRIPEVLNPFRYGLFSYQIWSHKILRWLVPWFLLGVLISSAALARASPLFSALLFLQGIGYGTVAAAHAFPRLRRLAPIRLGYYFVQANAALLKASVLFLMGVRIVTWNPSVR
jgi:glycosyltransferase involved in cell wall biosynthesis